jgi:Bacterial Ig-like domain (group 2)
MTKKWVLATILLSLAISAGCRNVKGISNVKVVVTNSENLSILFVTQALQFTATVTGTSNTAVTWSLSSGGCTGDACGTLSSSGLYTAPATSPGSNVSISITATSVADNTASDSFSVKVHQITVQITPSPVKVGKGLTQQFTAVALPDDAPQTVTWSIANCTGSCGSIDPNTGLYTAPATVPSPATFQVQAAVPPALDPSGFNTANVTVVSSRLVGNSTYAFRFSGFNTAGATALAGNFAVAADGQTISSGVEDELTTGGPAHRTLTGFYTPASNNSNNQATLTLNPSGGVPPNTYTVVHFSTGKRVGYAALLPMDGAGNIGAATRGLIDLNEGGTASAASDVTGSYTMTNGIGTMTLTSATLSRSFHFNLYGVSGQAKANDPLTVYAISTDLIATNPGVSGTVVFQAPDSNSYNNSTFKFTSVVSLTGLDSALTNSNVSLTLVSTDGSGNLSGNFDQNNGGTVLSVSNFSAGYTYLATGSGRYTFKLLGNPNANPVVPPLTFVLYASAANQGFLLDQSSPSVLTGTMYAQLKNHFFAVSEIPGTHAAATTSSATKLVDPIAANLLLTFANPTTGVSGTQFDTSGSAAVSGAYTLDSSGTGTITLTAPSAESTVTYAIDVTHILVMDVTGTANSGTANPSILFVQQ